MKNSFGSRLKKLRHLKELSIEEVSKKIGVPASTYREWESGRAIQGEPYLKIAEVFGVSVHELLSGHAQTASRALTLIRQIESLCQELEREVKNSLSND